MARATIAASVSPERGSGQSSSTRFHGQLSTICMPGNLVTASTAVAACLEVSPYWLCRTYTISKMTDCGMTPAILLSSAALRSASAASCCALFRSTKNETKTLASATTLCTSDAPSRFASFGDGGQRVRAVFDEPSQFVERRAIGGDRHAAAEDFPPQFGAGLEVKRFANFLRHSCLSLAGHGRDGHGLFLLAYSTAVRIRSARAGPAA